MGAMSALAAEKEEEINHLHLTYREAYAEYMDYMDKHPPAFRKPHEQDELSRLMGRCMIARMHWENAEAQRYKIR